MKSAETKMAKADLAKRMSRPPWSVCRVTRRRLSWPTVQVTSSAQIIKERKKRPPS